jgi:hypothetical protein
MSMLSMSNAVAALPRLLSNLEHVLKLGEQNAKERNIDETVFLTARLAPDMWPLAKQVQTVAELAKNAPFRIAGLNAPSYEGHPESFDACYAILEQAITDIKSVSAEDLDGKEGREFTLEMGPQKTPMEFTGISYLSGFSLPNIYFHCTTVYNILRHNGVPLGKRDFFGGVLK